jgi:RimJ/RimL family protein N-acetyltransferase
MNKYKVLIKQIYSKGEHSIVPIRFEDRFSIMKWRNEQMYHLRQKELLTIENQNNYFNKIVSQLFTQDQPQQLLFSYLKNNTCIGYGGLVHINWEDKKAEISFIMNTELEKTDFDTNWSIYLGLIEQLAFKELNLNTLFTYAYDLRPHLYPTLEKNGFELKSRLTNQIVIDGEHKDVLIHEKQNPNNDIKLRKAAKEDVNLIFDWSNDDLVRKQSYSSDKIELKNHIKWYNSKYQDPKSLFLILELRNKPFGLVRFDIQKENAIVGVLIGSNYRGKGLSINSLILACSEYFKSNDQPILAYIKETNKASISAFGKAGFQYYKDELVDGISSYVYQLKKDKNV